MQNIFLIFSLMLFFTLSHPATSTQLEEETKSFPLEITCLEDNYALELMSSENTLRITQRDTGFASKDSNKTTIATFGVSRCCVLTTYDPTSTKTSLSHVDVFTDLDDLSRLADAICEANKRFQVQVALISGNQDLIDNIQVRLKGLGFQNIVTDLDIVAQNSHGIHVAVTSKDPKVIKSYFTISRLSNQDLPERIKAFLKRKEIDKTLNFIIQE